MAPGTNLSLLRKANVEVHSSWHDQRLGCEILSCLFFLFKCVNEYTVLWNWVLYATISHLCSTSPLYILFLEEGECNKHQYEYEVLLMQSFEFCRSMLKEIHFPLIVSLLSIFGVTKKMNNKMVVDLGVSKNSIQFDFKKRGNKMKMTWSFS